jgi:hypothetical protein
VVILHKCAVLEQKPYHDGVSATPYRTPTLPPPPSPRGSVPASPAASRLAQGSRSVRVLPLPLWSRTGDGATRRASRGGEREARMQGGEGPARCGLGWNMTPVPERRRKPCHAGMETHRSDVVTAGVKEGGEHSG